MAEKKSTEDLYIMVNSSIYRNSKSAVLKSQANLLTTLKHLQNLKVLARQKRDLKIQLRNLLSSTINISEKMEDYLPDPKIPRKLLSGSKANEKETESKTEEKKQTFKLREGIDEELRQIQDKLKAING